MGPVRAVEPAVASSGSGALAPRLRLARLGAALAASVVLHAVAAASLELFAGGGGARPAPRAAAGLRVTLVALSDAPAAAVPHASRPPAASAPGPSALFPGATYFTAAELDRRAEAVSEIDPEYPAGGPPGGGQLLVRILINERGRADRVQVLEAEPRGIFERAVVDAFSAGLYRPGERNGRPVKSQMTVAVTFHAENPAQMPSQPAAAQPR